MGGHNYNIDTRFVTEIKDLISILPIAYMGFNFEAFLFKVFLNALKVFLGFSNRCGLTFDVSFSRDGINFGPL